MSKLLDIISVKLIGTELKVDQLSSKILTQKWPPEKVEVLMIIKYYKILIYPRDKYINNTDIIWIHMKQFLTYYQKVKENKDVNVQTCK